MKKIIFSVLTMFVALSVSAANTASATITITGSTTGSDKVRIAEAPQFTAGFDNGYDAYQPDANIPGIYVVSGAARLTDCVTNLMDGLTIGVVAGADETYTLSFSNVTGGYKLIDLVAGVISDMSSNYVFSMDANTRNDHRFVIMKTVSFTVTTNTSGYATYSNSLDLVLEDAQAGDPKVYSAEYSTSGDEGLLTLHEEAGANANCGVIIKGEPSTTYTLIPGTVADYLNTNSLSASVEETTLDASHQNFCMATINGLCAFYEYTGAKVSANKAYLTFGGTDAPKRIRMVVAGATALEDASAEAEVKKVLVDGQVLIIRDGVRYNLQGQIVK